MEILRSNYFSLPETSFTGSSASTTTNYFKNIIDRDNRTAFITDNYNSDAATFVLISSFSSYKVINRLAIMDHNLKQFEIAYIYTTSGLYNTLTLTTSSGTILSSWLTNSLTNNYLMFASVTCLGIRISMTKTITANDEKSVGYLSVSETLLDLTQKPGYSGYSLINKDQSINHQMANGGHRTQTNAQKMSAKLSLNYIGSTLQSSFYDLYFDRKEMLFVPNPPTTTAASWDEQIFPCVWSNGFDFETYSDNCETPYFSGTIQLDEVPK